MGGKALIPRSMRVPRKCNRECYQTRVLPVLNKKNVRNSSKLAVPLIPCPKFSLMYYICFGTKTEHNKI